jgi:hypothetical protein
MTAAMEHCKHLSKIEWDKVGQCESIAIPPCGAAGYPRPSGLRKQISPEKQSNLESAFVKKCNNASPQGGSGWGSQSGLTLQSQEQLSNRLENEIEESLPNEIKLPEDLAGRKRFSMEVISIRLCGFPESRTISSRVLCLPYNLGRAHSLHTILLRVPNEPS